MHTHPSPHRRVGVALKAKAGFSLVELMVAITISLILMAALVSLYVHFSRSNSELARVNSQIESGRLAVQLLEIDLSHAGFFGSYVPQFDDLTSNDPPSLTSEIGGSVPTSIPDPCLTYNPANWTAEYRANLIGIPIQVHSAMPANCVNAPSLLANQKPNTDVLVIRHVEPCEAGVSGCANTAGSLYFQSSLCDDELSGLIAQGGSANSITLHASASSVDDFYVGQTVRIVNGPGFGRYGIITAYNGSTKVASVSPPWGSNPPNGFSKYVFGVGYVLDTVGFTFTRRNCTTLAPKYKFVSNIYYVRDYAQTVGDGTPTLVRSEFDLNGGALSHQPAKALVEGVDGFRVELGVDRISDSGIDIISDANSQNRYTAKIIWANPENLTSPTNRGDGIPDGAYVHCTTATPPCSKDQFIHAVTAKLHLLVRGSEPSPGYIDNKIYYLDSARAVAHEPCVDSTGATLTGSAFTTCRSYKRHVFSTTVRLNNISSRRETP